MIYSRAVRFNRIEFALVLGIAFGLLIHLSFTSLFGISKAACSPMRISPGCSPMSSLSALPWR